MGMANGKSIKNTFESTPNSEYVKVRLNIVKDVCSSKYTWENFSPFRYSMYQIDNPIYNCATASNEYRYRRFEFYRNLLDSEQLTDWLNHDEVWYPIWYSIEYPSQNAVIVCALNTEEPKGEIAYLVKSSIKLGVVDRWNLHLSCDGDSAYRFSNPRLMWRYLSKEEKLRYFNYVHRQYNWSDSNVVGILNNSDNDILFNNILDSTIVDYNLTLMPCEAKEVLIRASGDKHGMLDISAFVTIGKAQFGKCYQLPYNKELLFSRDFGFEDSYYVQHSASAHTISFGIGSVFLEQFMIGRHYYRGLSWMYPTLVNGRMGKFELVKVYKNNNKIFGFRLKYTNKEKDFKACVITYENLLLGMKGGLTVKGLKLVNGNIQVTGN